MILILSFFPCLLSVEREAVQAALAKLLDHNVINRFDRYVHWYRDPDDSWTLEVDGIYTYGGARERAVEDEIAERVAKAIQVATRGAHFTIKVTVEHGCSACDHSCESEEQLWTTHSPALPEERELMSALLNGEI